MLEPSIQPDGPKIRSLRKAKKLTQEKLAEKSDCSKRTIENAEASKRINETSLEAIALALDTPAIDLVIPDLERRLQSRWYEAISDSRRQFLTGKWTGTGCDQAGESGAHDPQTFGVSWELHVIGKQILGRGTVTYPDRPGDPSASFDLEGGFIHERFCQLNYVTKDGAAIRFGSIIVDFAGDGRSLTGCYAGFTHNQGDIVHGGVRLAKEVSDPGSSSEAAPGTSF